MPLHALMFGWEYPPRNEGGLGVACRGLVRGLVQNGTAVTLVLPAPVPSDHDLLSIRSPQDIGTEKLLTIKTVTSNLQPYDGPSEFAERVHRKAAGSITQHDLYGPDRCEAVEQYTAMCVALTDDLQPDVIHCHDWMTYDAGRIAAKHHDVPLVAHIHATELDRTDFQPNTWIVGREREGLLAADTVIAVSRYTKDMLTAYYGIPASKITVVHNGHDMEHVHAGFKKPMAKGPLVLFLGRLTVQKNPFQFLEVAKLIHDERPDAQFVMAGDGPLLGQLMERSCSLGLQDCVLFTGRASRREVNALYAQASCFVMPSLSEPFGLVALEAIAHGVPVVLSKQSGASEVIDHGFKVDFWDTEKMADCIVTILREEPLATQLSAEAPRILQKLTWKSQASEVQSLYRDLTRAAR